MKHVKGFVSNIYVFISSVAYISGVLLVATYMISLPSFDLGRLIVVALFAIIYAIYIVNHSAPLAFMRYSLNSNGIRCGKNKIAYEAIETVTIATGYIEERYGQQWCEDAFGLDLHNELWVEDIIVINGVYLGFNPEDKKSVIYLPRNKDTDRLLKEHCPKYVNAAVDFDSSKQSLTRSCKTKKRDIFSFAFYTICVCFIEIALATMGVHSLPRAITLILFWGIFISSASFEEVIVSKISNWVNGRIGG